MASFWRSMILAAAALAVVAAGAGLAAAAKTETRVETSTADGGKTESHVWINGQEVKPGQPLAAAGDGQGDVHIWINGKEVKPGDPIDMGAGGKASIRVEARSGARPGNPELSPEAIPGAPGEAYLGVMATPLAVDKAREELESHKGVMVTTVVPGSPAAKAGIQAGDVIADIGGTAMETPQQLVDHIRQYKPGTEVKVVFYREGKRMEKTLVLGVRPGTGLTVRPPAPKEAAPPEAFLGLAPAPLTKEVAGLAGTDRGVLVNSLPDESPAAKAGLQPGDVIVSVGGREVGSSEDLVRAVGEHKPGDVVKVVYFRMGKKGTAEVKLGARAAAVNLSEGQIEIPDDVLRSMPELRQFLDEMSKGLQGRVERFRQGNPGVVPPVQPPAAEPYGMGKDIGKIIERLDRLDQRLDQIEKRLDQLEKKK